VNEIYASIYTIIKNTRLSVTQAVSVTGRQAGRLAGDTDGLHGR